ncbi:lytic transglycosylase [Crenobacter intestini]|uniref:LysM peptidoglycan-binding domain-containing protein n=1 Tax=Crenobacter intestini TaxID=2563443 RepID=A0A4T0UT79_9NEIS|nr:LysM peptidoglycan-binding domain-containing protein [Crenobacter intestini]TIC82134.1 LysM peptidoglycan-binding domain-containing protein [Crenobacter intestini]
MKKFSIALSLSLAFTAWAAPAKAATIFGKPERLAVDEALAVGLDMMLQNTSLLRNGDNLILRMREGFQMSEVNPELVRRLERQYAANPAGLRRSMDRSRKYLFYIMNEVERRGMPTELALLPVVESAFVPTARSHVGAAGLWQFMPATGRQYGLEQTWWYDGRRDVVESTNAALDYLQMLYGMFGDWSLALASYNWGQGNVSRAIERARAQGLEPTYENLRLPNETRNYVPKLLAVRNVVLEPERFNLSLGDFPNKPYFVAISTGRHMDIDVAARLAEMPVSEFKELNPAFNLPVYAHKSGRQMLLPADRLHRFERNVAKWDKPLMNWEVHVPQDGVEASTLAGEYGMNVGELLAVNNARGGRFAPGQPVLVASRNARVEPLTLRVANERRATAFEVPVLATLDSSQANPPASAPAVLAAAEPAAVAQVQRVAVAEQAAPAIQPLAIAPLQAPAMATTTQTVAVAEPATQATQTLAIAPLQAPAAAPTAKVVALAEPATPAAAIAPLVASATQAAPQGLVVAEQAKPVRVAATERKVATRAVEAVASAQQANVANLHTVQGGDTLYNISRRYGMNVAQLQALNGLEDSRLQLGQTLKVSGTPIIGTPVSAEADAVSELASLTGGQPQREYIVQTGDTVYGIARKFGVHHTDIKRWNAAARLAALQPGQRLIVQGL